MVVVQKPRRMGWACIPAPSSYALLVEYTRSEGDKPFRRQNDIVECIMRPDVIVRKGTSPPDGEPNMPPTDFDRTRQFPPWCVLLPLNYHSSNMHDKDKQKRHVCIWFKCDDFQASDICAIYQQTFVQFRHVELRVGRSLSMLNLNNIIIPILFNYTQAEDKFFSISCFFLNKTK